jgi:biopolymer transport protein TolR
MTMNYSGHRSMQSDINVTPMIDVLLVLLIIFMVIVPVTSKGESALAPNPAPHIDLIPENPIVLEVLNAPSGTADFRINQQSVSRQDLPARLEAIFANRARRVLFVKGDDRLAFTQIAEAIDIAHAAGIERVGLITPKTAQVR